jgi:spore coat polysaccharide biosynthesis protein SpsF
MKIIAITQARYGSSRLPGKVLMKIGEKTLLQIHLERVLKSTLINKLIVATTQEPQSEEIIEIANSLGCTTYQGSLNDVLERFYYAALPEKPDYVVRITSDCPLIDAEIIDCVITKCIESNVDYVSNTLRPTFPDGVDVEVFKFSALKKAFEQAQLPSEREHVSSYIWKNSDYNGAKLFSAHCFKSEIDYSRFRITVDTQEDYLLLKKLINLLGDNLSWQNYVDYLVDNEDITKINSNNTRNAGYIKSINNDKNNQ